MMPQLKCSGTVCRIMHTYKNAISPSFKPTMIVMHKLSYSTVVLYVRDHDGLGFSAQQYHPKISFTFPKQQYWLGIAKPKNVFNLTLNL